MIQDTPVKGRERPATEKSSADFTLLDPFIAKNVMMAKVITNIVWYKDVSLSIGLMKQEAVVSQTTDLVYQATPYFSNNLVPYSWKPGTQFSTPLRGVKNKKSGESFEIRSLK